LSHDMDFDSKESLKRKVLEGVDILADNVASTYGPCGLNVILQEKDKDPFVTKDGVTVARFVHLNDPFMNAGAQILKQAAIQTNNDAGDGTTTSTILSRAIMKRAQLYITDGVPAIEIKRGLDFFLNIVVDTLKDNSRPIESKEDIMHVATISANNDDSIGEMIAMAVDKVGRDGAITIEESNSGETTLDITEGFVFSAGYRAGAFVTDRRRAVMHYENPLILITDHKISTVEQVLPVLELAARESRPMIFVADEIEEQALAALIMNAMRGTLKVAAIKAPQYGEEKRSLLDDLAISVDAKFISRESGMALRDVKLEHLGSAKTIESTSTSTTIVGGNANYAHVESRIEGLKQQLNQTVPIHECEAIQHRITRLASGVAVIRVGAPTEVEMIEKKHRVEDALEAVRSAQEDGIIPGGGTALYKVASLAQFALAVQNDGNAIASPAQAIGIDILRQALQEPIMQLAKNSNQSGEIILSYLRCSECPFEKGWDFKANEFIDLYKAGVVDPTKVVCSALRNAVSVAGTLLTTNYAIIEK
jgi:chaperonin GroEL